MLGPMAGGSRGYAMSTAGHTTYGARQYGDPLVFTGYTVGPRFQPDRGLTIVTGVSQMNDQAATALHVAQATPGSQPAVSNINGVQALLYDGVDDVLSRAGVTNNPTHTIVLVIRPEAVGAASDLFPFLDDNAGIKKRSAGLDQWQQSNGVTSGSQLVTGTAYVLGLTVRGNADRDFWTNGLLLQDVTNSAPAAVGFVSLGAHAAPFAFTNCTIGDSVRFNQPLPTGVLTRIMKSAAAKFKIATVI